MSAWLAPLFLIAGFVLGGLAQPESYHWQWHSISSLASYGAHQRYWMTAGLVGNGLCHLVNAWHLRRTGASPMMIAGGLGVLLVAAFPEEHGVIHDAAAGLAFFLLAIWPLFATDERFAPMRLQSARLASFTMLGLLAWFVLTLFGAPALGLVERALALAEALWPLVVLESMRPAAAPQVGVGV